MAEPPVVNASPLSILARAGRLELLRNLGQRILVPALVVQEVKAHSDQAAQALENHNWLEETPIAPIPDVILAWDLGVGESAVLSWAFSHPGTLAVIDDYAARKCAYGLGIPTKGTLGLILLAKTLGQIAVARPVLEEMRRAGLYLSDSLVQNALLLVGE